MKDNLIIYFCAKKKSFVLENNQGHEVRRSKDLNRLVRYCWENWLNYEYETDLDRFVKKAETLLLGYVCQGEMTNWHGANRLCKDLKKEMIKLCKKQSWENERN